MLLPFDSFLNTLDTCGWCSCLSTLFLILSILVGGTLTLRLFFQYFQYLWVVLLPFGSFLDSLDICR